VPTVPSRRLLVALASVLVVVAGCAAPTAPAPDDGTTDVSVSLSNDHDEPYRVTLSLVAGEYESVEVSYVDGTTRRVGATSPAEVPRSALDGAVGFVPVGPTVESAVYDLRPGTGVGDTVPDAPENVTLVYVVGRPTATDPADTLRSYGAVTCGSASDAFEFSLDVGPNGSLGVGSVCAG
jgi:hypothetical protein